MEELKLNLSESTTHWWERLAQRHAERKFSAEHPEALSGKTESIVRIFFESLVHRLFVFCWNKYKTFYAQQWAPLSTQSLSEKDSSTSLSIKLDACKETKEVQEAQPLDLSEMELPEKDSSTPSFNQTSSSSSQSELDTSKETEEDKETQPLDLPEMEQPPIEDSRIQMLSGQNTRLYEENKAQERELEALRQRISQQEMLLQRPLEETERMRAEHQRITVALGRAELQIAQMREELAGFADLQTRHNQLNDHFEEVEENLTRITSQLRAQELTYERLEAEHRDLTTDHVTLTEECSTLRTTLEALQKQLEKAKESERQLTEKLKTTEEVALADHDEQTAERSHLEDALSSEAKKEKSLREREQRCLALEEENRALKEKIGVLLERTLWEENENGDAVATAVAPKRLAFAKPPTPKKLSASQKRING